MSLSSAKAKLDAQGGDPATGYISKQDHKDSYDQLVADTALTGDTTAAALDVTGALTAGTVASDGTVAGTGLAGGLLSAATPVINGTAAPGTSAIPSRQDHVHASDTTRAPLASPTFTGTVTIPSGLVLGTVTHAEGSGSPQSVVTAIVGSTYIDTAATTGAIKWVKASGTGNTGWVVEYGDTGVRNIKAVLENSWTTYGGTDPVYLRRIGSVVQLDTAGIVGTTSSAATMYTLPVGFRPTATLNNFFANYTGAGPSSNGMTIVGNGSVVLGGTRTLYTSGRLFASWFTSDAWPSSLPGS